MNSHLSHQTGRKEPRSITLGQIRIDAVTENEALSRAEGFALGNGGTIFTPNLHHIALGSTDEAFAAAYGRAELSLCDGKLVQWAARPLGGLPARIAGSLFLPKLLAVASSNGWSTYFVGGRMGINDRLPFILASRFPGLKCAGVTLPTQKLLSFTQDEWAAVVEDIHAVRPAVVLVSLPSPMQEIWADATFRRLGHTAFICTGSAIDRVVGLSQSPPSWLGELGLEWLWRVAQEPTRLAPRYFSDALIVAPILVRAWAQAIATSSSGEGS